VIVVSLTASFIYTVSVSWAFSGVVETMAIEDILAIEDLLLSEDTIATAEFQILDVFITVVEGTTMLDEVPLIVHVAELNAGEEYYNVFQRYGIIIAVAFIIIGAISAYIISRQTLKPMKTLAEKIEDIDANNLDTPIELPKANDELSSLTHSFNNMLGKLNRSFNSHKLFAQNAAHELKTPLASIMTNIEVLQLDDEPSMDEYKEVVGVVKDNTARLIDLVEGLLSANNAIDETRWQTFNVSEVFETIINNLNDDIERKHLNVDLSGECHIRGDKVLLERAFQNLVHNAVRYNIENGTIEISLENDEISIEDSGIGIPKENLENIFEPFYCVDNSRSKNLGGHGLGMTIAKNIFDMHRIKICVSSEAGKGTKIILKLNEI